MRAEGVGRGMRRGSGRGADGAEGLGVALEPAGAGTAPETGADAGVGAEEGLAAGAGMDWDEDLREEGRGMNLAPPAAAVLPVRPLVSS